MENRIIIEEYIGLLKALRNMDVFHFNNFKWTRYFELSKMAFNLTSLKEIYDINIVIENSYNKINKHITEKEDSIQRTTVDAKGKMAGVLRERSDEEVYKLEMAIENNIKQFIYSEIKYIFDKDLKIKIDLLIENLYNFIGDNK